MYTVILALLRNAFENWQLIPQSEQLLPLVNGTERAHFLSMGRAASWGRRQTWIEDQLCQWQSILYYSVSVFLICKIGIMIPTSDVYSHGGNSFTQGVQHRY